MTTERPGDWTVEDGEAQQEREYQAWLRLTPCPECGALGWVEPCSECRDIDRSVLARIGGRMLLAHDYSAWAPEHVRDAALIVYRAPRYTTARLPEAAFDWPIYRAAMLPTVIARLNNPDNPAARLTTQSGQPVWMCAQDIAVALALPGYEDEPEQNAPVRMSPVPPEEEPIE